MQRRMTFEEFQYLMMIGGDQSILDATFYAMDALNGKWKLKILFLLYTGQTIRFNEIKRALKGITSRQLISDLRSLEEASFIDKEKSPENREVKIYVLTDKGRDLLYLFYDFMNWGYAYQH